MAGSNSELQVLGDKLAVSMNIHRLEITMDRSKVMVITTASSKMEIRINEVQLEEVPSKYLGGSPFQKTVATW